MIAKGPVNVNLQTLFIFIPIVSIWAYYRIKKLTMGIITAIIMNVGIFLGGSIGGAMFGYIISGVLYVVAVVINIILIRKWSSEWNQQFKK